ncbi:hypothetical protein BKA80DRAFT_314210 [Phyllosticta citrichinensis]
MRSTPKRTIHIDQGPNDATSNPPRRKEAKARQPSSGNRATSTRTHRSPSTNHTALSSPSSPGKTLHRSSHACLSPRPLLSVNPTPITVSKKNLVPPTVRRLDVGPLAASPPAPPPCVPPSKTNLTLRTPGSSRTASHNNFRHCTYTGKSSGRQSPSHDLPAVRGAYVNVRLRIARTCTGESTVRRCVRADGRHSGVANGVREYARRSVSAWIWRLVRRSESDVGVLLCAGKTYSQIWLRISAGRPSNDRRESSSSTVFSRPDALSTCRNSNVFVVVISVLPVPLSFYGNRL